MQQEGKKKKKELEREGKKVKEGDKVPIYNIRGEQRQDIGQTMPFCLFVCFKGRLGTGACPGSPLCLTNVSVFTEDPQSCEFPLHHYSG